MSTTTSTTTIEALQTIFATHGLPKVFVSDNGSQFMSAEFQTFLDKNGVCHLCSAPYHRSTNDLAERAVQSFKRNMEKNQLTPGLPDFCLNSTHYNWSHTSRIATWMHSEVTLGSNQTGCVPTGEGQAMVAEAEP